MDQSCPIGVIDSGIGGFSVVRRVRQLLPHEDLIYFGDGGNTPYGNHQAGEILRLTRYMLEFMKEKQIKVLLVACNTISCLIDAYRDEMDCPVFSVVQAGAEAVAGLPVKRVGVISTCFTASTRCYPDLITKLAPEKQVFSRGSKYLAGLVEHSMGGEIDWAFIDKELKESLDPLVWEGKVECCLLGCTHYPWWRGASRACFPICPSSTRPSAWPRRPGTICGSTTWITPRKTRVSWTSSPRAARRSTPARRPRRGWDR